MIQKLISDYRIVFWGCGKIGKQMASLCSYYGAMPNFWVDRDLQKWGSYICGIKVISPDELCGLTDTVLFITCKDKDGVVSELSELDFSGVIYDGSNIIELINNYEFLRMRIKEYISIRNIVDNMMVAFMLDNGVTLGGVESWTIDSARRLSCHGYYSCIIINDRGDNSYQVDDCDVIKLGDPYNTNSVNDKFIGLVDMLAKYKKLTLVCNFAGELSTIAVAVKSVLDNRSRLIQVIHNDEEGYYDFASKFKASIDSCLVISNRIEEKLLASGFPNNKIQRLQWHIVCGDNDHNYSQESEKLRIGYSGRITVKQKRSDLILVLAEELWKRKLKFTISVVGTGDYYDQLITGIKERPYGANIKALGFIERENIPSFWQKQDICISCSEWEGRSISMAEAMANGAVPVVTDTSGARDDIDDGINGYVVPVGDVMAIADKIEYLYYNRNKLSVMGHKAHDTILENNRQFNKELFWNKLFNG